MKTLLSILTASTLAGLAAAQGASLSLTVTPEKDHLLRGGPRESIIQIELKSKDPTTKRETPLNLCLVLDRSGSMSGAKLENAKQAAEVALDQLTANDYFSVVTYDNEVNVLIPPQKAEDKDALKSAIRSITAGGSTALYAGVQQGAEQLRKNFDAKKINRIILLSDGMANRGPSSPGDLSKLGQELRQEGFGVSTVGVGDDYNEDLMTALAEAGNANYYYVKDADKLPDIFTKELGTTKRVAARNISIKITLPDGVKPRGVIGDAGISFTGQMLVIPLAELTGGQTRRFLISCDAPASEAREIEIANVEMVYEDPTENRQVRENRTARVQQSADQDVVEKSTQPEVAAQVAITRNRETKEKAMRMADAGQSQEAADLLVRQQMVNTSLPAVSQSPLLQQENATLLRQAMELQRSGSFSKASRKEMQYQIYQDKNQQR